VNFFGLNRSTLNGGVSGIVAGAALVVAASALASTATRVVLPSSNAAASATVQANGRTALLGVASLQAQGALAAQGTRVAFGSAGIIVELNATAYPALLQLVSADIPVSGQLLATPTTAWGHSQAQLGASATRVQNGAGTLAAVWSVALDPLVVVGFASHIEANSSATADARTRPVGFAGWMNDGYALIGTSTTFTADGLKTARGFAAFEVDSRCVSDGIHIHGGRALLTSSAEVSAAPASDSAQAQTASSLVATPVRTQHGASGAELLAGFTATPTRTTFAAPITVPAESALIGDGRLAERAEAQGGSESGMSADGRLAERAEAQLLAGSDAAAAGAIIKLGEAQTAAESGMTAQWAILRLGFADIAATSGATATGRTNLEAPDPDSRTLRRLGVDRTLQRPFVDRTMRRSA